MSVTQLVTTKYRLQNALNFKQSIASNNFYAFAGTSFPWTTNVPQYYDNPHNVEFLAYNDMLFGKSILSSDTSLMCQPSLWTSGTVYTMYDDRNPNLSSSNFTIYFFDGSYYHVFKCLYNNNGSVSTSLPVTYLLGPQNTTDGYVWIYMYRISTAVHDKFNVSSYLPIVIDASVAAAAVPGAVNVIVPVDANNNITSTTGAGYNNYFSGQLLSAPIVASNTSYVQLGTSANSVTNFYAVCYFYVNGGTGAGQYKQVISSFPNTSGIYCQLDSIFATNLDTTSTYQVYPGVVVLNSSDQTSNVAAMALVSANTGNSIYSVQVLNTGAGVYAAGATVNVSNVVGVSNIASLRVICGPIGGHGSNVYSELYSNTVGMSVTFANSQSNTIPTIGDYQTVGIISNPTFANVTFVLSSQNGTFSIGENISQIVGNTTANAIVTSAVSGTSVTVSNCEPLFVVSGNSIIGSTSFANAQVSSILINGIAKSFNTFTQYYTYGGSYSGGTFVQNELVYQTSANVSNAIFFGNNSTGSNVYITTKYGPIYASNTLTGNTSGATFTINTITPPDLVPESGDLIYLENFTAINRSSTTSETIKLLFQF